MKKRNRGLLIFQSLLVFPPAPHPLCGLNFLRSPQISFSFLPNAFPQPGHVPCGGARRRWTQKPPILKGSTPPGTGDQKPPPNAEAKNLVGTSRTLCGMIQKGGGGGSSRRLGDGQDPGFSQGLGYLLFWEIFCSYLGGTPPIPPIPWILLPIEGEGFSPPPMCCCRWPPPTRTPPPAFGSDFHLHRIFFWGGGLGVDFCPGLNKDTGALLG